MPNDRSAAAPSRWAVIGVPIATMLIVLGAGVMLSWLAADRVLRDYAHDEASSWAGYFERNLNDLPGVIAGESVGLHDSEVLTLAKDAGHVFRYLIFDPTGRIVFSTDFLETGGNRQDLAGHGRKMIDDALLRGEIVVELADGTDQPDRPERYAEAYAPLLDGDQVVGVIEVYVDMTSTVARYWHTMGFAITALAALLAIAALLPGGLIWLQYERLRRAEAQIRELAFRDPLTGLVNRRQFQDELAMAIATATRRDQAGALLQIDLDYFKSVNDNLGHHAGDELLKAVATRVKACLRCTDILARLGGDELAVILPAEIGFAQVDKVAERIRSAMAEPFTVDGKSIRSSLSIGIALFPEHGQEPVQLLSNADIALYKAKEAGRGRHAFFEAAMQAKVDARRRLESDIREAMDQKAFEMHFQPLVRLDGMRIKGAEALLRWRHPSEGLLSAGAFIPALADSDLLTPLSWAATRLTFEALAALRRAGHANCRISLNLASAQMHHADIVDRLQALLVEHGVSSSQVTLEITEGVVLSRAPEKMAAKLHALHDVGFRLSLDDFGTGFASLVHLKHLPIDQLKIDRSFVRDITSDREDEAIVHGILAMCRPMGIEVVTEGIETDAQLQRLVEHGAAVGQGFLLGRPMPLGELTTLLDRQAGVSRETGALSLV